MAEEESMIERVAATIARKDRNIIAGDYEDMAKAVLAEMRTPSPTMLDAILRDMAWIGSNTQRQAHADTITQHWQIMIDAALGDEEVSGFRD